MIFARLPANESARLAALQALQVLDTPPEEQFDALVKAASLVCGVPVGFGVLGGRGGDAGTGTGPWHCCSGDRLLGVGPEGSGLEEGMSGDAEGPSSFFPSPRDRLLLAGLGGG